MTTTNRTNTHRQLRYYRLMKARGFTRHTVFIHEEDRDEIMELINARKERRLAETKTEESQWL